MHYVTFCNQFANRKGYWPWFWYHFKLWYSILSKNKLCKPTALIQCICAFCTIQITSLLSFIEEPCFTWDIQNKRGTVFPDLIGSHADVFSKITPGHCRDGELTLIWVVFVTGVVKGGRPEVKEAETQSVCHYCSLINTNILMGGKTNK